MKCGTPTNDRLLVRKKTRNANYNPNHESSLENHPLAVLINFFAGKYHHRVEVTIPFCGNCKQGGAPEPDQIDFESRTMTFIGHRSWKDDLEREQRQKTIA